MFINILNNRWEFTVKTTLLNWCWIYWCFNVLFYEAMRRRMNCETFPSRRRKKIVHVFIWLLTERQVWWRYLHVSASSVGLQLLIVHVYVIEIVQYNVDTCIHVFKPRMKLRLLNSNSIVLMMRMTVAEKIRGIACLVNQSNHRDGCDHIDHDRDGAIRNITESIKLYNRPCCAVQHGTRISTFSWRIQS